MAEIWVGKEVEGFLKGVNTLFVATKNITFKELYDIAGTYNSNNHSNPIEQIYFGAGCCKPFNEKVIQQCLKTFIAMYITVEIKMSKVSKYHKKKWFKECNIIVSHDTSIYENLLKLKTKKLVQVKLQSIKSNQPMLCTFELDKLEWTDMKMFDKKEMYKDDVIIK